MGTTYSYIPDATVPPYSFFYVDFASVEIQVCNHRALRPLSVRGLESTFMFILRFFPMALVGCMS